MTYTAHIPNTQAFILDGANEVRITRRVPLATYTHTVSPEEMDTAKRLAHELAGQRILFINSTPQGGGVAVMRQALIPFLTDLSVDVHWHVMLPDHDVFTITKRKIHNVLQGVAPIGTELTEEDLDVYRAWIEKNGAFLSSVIRRAGIIVIDDPQPSGLIPYIRMRFPSVKIVYRSHIEIDTEKLSGGDRFVAGAWEFLWDHIRTADRFVFHPVPAFVPKEVPSERVTYMPASTDAFSDLNRVVTAMETRWKLDEFNRMLAETGQTPLDPKRPYLIQVCRFDPSKGIPDVLEAYRRLAERFRDTEKVLPQLVIAGNGAVDDPDGPVLYRATRETLTAERYAHVRNDVKVALLPPDDLLLNVLLRKSSIVLQLSESEGFEVKVTEALMKGKPVVVFRAGGLPLQVKDGVNGYVVAPGDTDGVVRHLYALSSDASLYTAMSRAATEHYDRSFLTVPNAVRWMRLWLELVR